MANVVTRTGSIPKLLKAAALLHRASIPVLLKLGRWVDGHHTASLSLLLIIYLLSTLGYSLEVPLWHDELFTFYIAQAASIHDLLTQSRSIDLNPPLSYLLTRASFATFGVGTLQCRLPEIVAFGLALVSLFYFLRRRAGNAYGLLAAALLLAGRAGDPVIQARPYGLMLGFGALTLALWQASSALPRGPRARLINVFLCLSACALLLSHVFCLLIWMAIAAAEIVQSIDRRKIDFPRALALALPFLVTAFYIPLFRNHGASHFPVDFQPTANTIFDFYIAHISRELVCLWLTALVVVMFAGRTWLRSAPRFVLTFPEWIAISGLTAIPLAVIALLMHQHASFFERYGVVGSLGIVALFTVFLCRWANGRPSVAVIAVLLALLISSRIPDAAGEVVAGNIFRHTEPAVQPSGLDKLVPAELPLVDASGLTFLEMSQREPGSLLDRTFYLEGGPIAIQYAHATIFEGMRHEAEVFHLRAHTDTYPQFIAAHSHFYVLGTYDYPEDWLLRKLLADGAELRLVAHIDTLYRTRDLYEVTLYPVSDKH